MGEITIYRHHDRLVCVDKDLKGRHREHDLCYRCFRFNPGDPLNNCPIVQRLYELEVELGIAAPVWECPDMVEGKPQSTIDPEFPIGEAPEIKHKVIEKEG